MSLSQKYIIAPFQQKINFSKEKSTFLYRIDPTFQNSKFFPISNSATTFISFSGFSYWRPSNLNQEPLFHSIKATLSREIFSGLFPQCAKSDSFYEIFASIEPLEFSF